MGRQALITKKPRNNVKLVSKRQQKSELLTKPSPHTSIWLLNFSHFNLLTLLYLSAQSSGLDNRGLLPAARSDCCVSVSLSFEERISPFPSYITQYATNTGTYPYTKLKIYFRSCNDKIAAKCLLIILLGRCTCLHCC